MASNVRMRRIFSIVMASVQNIGINAERNKADNERTPHATGMSKETSPLPMNRTQGKESYWFAYGRAEEASPGNPLSDPKTTAEQKDREEKMRIFREQQEEERLRKLRDLEQQFLLAKKHREQQEEERRHRIEEARLRETERRHQVEERKRQIWEAEQERKEAILRRNMEREARIEARRNAQRNSQSFAFGSSTPRTFDLDLAAIGLGRHTNTVLMSSVGRRSEERELGPPRATSACSLDRKFESDSVLCDFSRSSSLDPMPTFVYKQIALQQKSSHDMKACLSMLENNLCDQSHSFASPSPGWLVGSGVLVGEDCMSRSMVSLSSSMFRGRRRTDIIPTLSRERSVTPHVTPRGNHTCMRAVSMTRLDQLAQPRRTYRDPGTTTDKTVSPSKSMCNLAPPAGRRAQRPPAQANSMSRSMLHLAGTPQRQSPSPTLAKSGMRSAQSMMHLAAPPRLTRAARLRAEALAGSRAASAWNLNKAGSNPNGYYLSPGKDSSRSPPRPQSSMSGASDISATSSSVSAVNMRPRPAPRRPRPYSVAGSIVSSQPTKKEPDRQPRGQDRAALVPRAKSACREGEDPKRPLSAPKKPLPPPKSSELLARAKSHPVPTKDNLRKLNKTATKPVDKISAEEDKSSEEQTVTDKIECKRKEHVAEEETQLNSAVASPTTDSEMLLVSSDDSKTVATSELSQSVTESEPQVEEASVASVEEAEKDAPKVTVEQIFPNEAPEKVSNAESGGPSKPRISSEEEARAALAEKRRLAREQAEREAELERQRLEEIRRQEEEQREREEQEQRRMEEEQIRLAELHRHLEQEKLARAIEEQQQREREEQERREEEVRQRVEKEEQEKKAREEAERQRVELEEKLRKEEEERAERKRRVEQIMARTRGKAAAQSPSSTPGESKATPVLTTPGETNIPNGTADSEAWPEQKPLPDILNAVIHSAKRNGAFVESESKIANSFSVSNRTLSANEDVSLQSNGYSSHEDMSCTTSPEESSDVGLLIDIQSNQQQRSSTQLVDPLGNVNNENFLIRVDDVNSNLFGNPFVDTLQKKQDTQMTDLLS